MTPTPKPTEAEARTRIAAWSDRVLLWTYLWCCAHDHDRAAGWMREELERREKQP